jgi:hypothetical protein
MNEHAKGVYLALGPGLGAFRGGVTVMIDLHKLEIRLRLLPVLLCISVSPISVVMRSAALI